MKDLRQKNFELTKKAIADSVGFDTILIQVVHSLDELEIVIRRLSVSLKEWYSYYAPSVLRVPEPEKLTALVKQKKREEMGGNFVKEDLDACVKFADEIESLIKLKEQHEKYLELLMKKTAPNLSKAAGYYIGAKLIALAGSLKHLAEMRSSTIQLLGAEKALFRFLKKGSRPPKFGVIYMHPNVSSVKDKAKVARKLASEIVIATRKDYFRK